MKLLQKLWFWSQCQGFWGVGDSNYDFA